MGHKQSDYRRGRVRKNSPTFQRKVKHRKGRDRDTDARVERKRTKANNWGWQ